MAGIGRKARVRKGGIVRKGSASMATVVASTVALTCGLLWLVAVAGSVAASELPLPVPRATIYPGEVIVEDNLAERAFIARTVARATVFEARDALVGKVARRTLLALQPIAINAVREPYLVNQGKAVLVIYETRGLTITSQATALENGSVGDEVSLRNNDSGLLIRGAVASDGSVRLRAP
jgi:flagella basal body P-ring formation protein FlgA